MWAFGLSYFTVGYLNANSAFLGAIVIGNGINFGLIFLARYLEELRKKRGHVRAIHAAITRTSTATWVAALAAGFSYGSLAFTEFRGFRQFGIIGLTGMVFCWVSAFTVLPAMLTLLDRWFHYAKRIRDSKRPRQFFSVWVSQLVKKRPALVWRFSLGLTGLSVLAFLLYDGHFILCWAFLLYVWHV